MHHAMKTATKENIGQAEKMYLEDQIFYPTLLEAHALYNRNARSTSKHEGLCERISERQIKEIEANVQANKPADPNKKFVLRH